MKDNILVATSNFGLGPVGKLASIVNAGKNDFNWFACGEKFEMKLFEENTFVKTCWSMEENEIKDFIDKYKINIAVVVLKNKIARILKKLNIKVIYIDSLPFMWTKEDAREGKIPYDVDIYCAQKSEKLSSNSTEIFKNVKNLNWVNPIVPIVDRSNVIKMKNIFLLILVDYIQQ